MFERGDIVELTPGASDWVTGWDQSVGQVMVVHSDEGDTFTGEWLLKEPLGIGSSYGTRFFRKIGHIELPPE